MTFEIRQSASLFRLNIQSTSDDSSPVQTVLGSQQSNAAIQGSKSCPCHVSVTVHSLSPPSVEIVPSEHDTTIDVGLR